MNGQRKPMKQDNPMKTMIVIAIALLAVTVISVLGVKLCQGWIDKDYTATRERIENENEEMKLDFDAKMNAMRASSASNNVVYEMDPTIEEELETYTATLLNSDWRLVDMGNTGLENAGSIVLNRSDMMNGGLLLVNSWHSIPLDFSTEGLIPVGKTSNFDIPVDSNNVMLFPQAYSALYEAILTAKEEAGLEHYLVREGYRSVQEQEELFNSRMVKLSSRYSGERLIEETKKDVNYPGTSDYHTGMSFRMDIFEKNNKEFNNLKFQAESEQGKWLTENCWRFGIIFRFPCLDFPNENWEDKSYKTGVSTQINLYRYVGKAHAAAMTILGNCLEEYLEFLIKHPHVCIYQDGTLKYEIVRMNAADSVEEFQLPLPNPAQSYQASLDNLGGIVLAYTY